MIVKTFVILYTFHILFFKQKGRVKMDFSLDEYVGITQLNLNFDVHMVGIDGENFTYHVYYFEEITEEKFEETKKVVDEFASSYTEQYLGYIDVSKEDYKVVIYLDLGIEDMELANQAICGLVESLNKVSGIKSVIINEDCSFDF